MLKLIRNLPAVSACLLCAGAVHVLHAQDDPVRVRWHGEPPTAETTPQPLGALLNPPLDYMETAPPGSSEFHPMYWGPAINSGVQITADPEEYRQTIRFDRSYALFEITLLVSGEGDVKLERAADPPEADADAQADDFPTEWQDAAEREQHRLHLPTTDGKTWLRLLLQPTRARAWRLTPSPTLQIETVLLWGDGPVQPTEPIYPVRKKFPIAFDSLPGADKTAMSDHIYWSWQRPLIADAAMKADGAVWVRHDKWTRISAAPILPAHDRINRPVRITMARNEVEGALLTLTSLRDQVGEPIHDSGIYRDFVSGFQEFEIRLDDLQGPTPDRVSITPRIAATLRSQLWGTVTGPLFAADNKIGVHQMFRYFTNGPMIADFPRVALPPCGSHVLWLDVETRDAAPGVYTARLHAAPGPSIPIEITVLPVTLPEPRVWVHIWSRGIPGTTWPYQAAETLANTVRDKIARGVSSFYGAPEPHTEAAEARRQKADTYFYHAYLVPHPWVGRGYASNVAAFEAIGDDDRQAIREHLESVVQRFRDLGVDYGDWIGELWDEPGNRNAALIAAAARWVKEIDPDVQVYANPIMTSIENFRVISDAVDVLVPFWGVWFDQPEHEYQAEIRPNRLNALYGIQGSNRSELHEELVGHYRILPWHAFILGLRGWGFYSYYSPRRDPYTDYHPAGSETDYQVVYPGPYGPVPTRQAEAMRDGWEDYRLLTLLAASDDPAAAAAVEWAVAQIPMGREPLTAHIDFEAIRLHLLTAAAALP